MLFCLADILVSPTRRLHIFITYDKIYRIHFFFSKSFHFSWKTKNTRCNGMDRLGSCKCFPVGYAGLMHVLLLNTALEICTHILLLLCNNWGISNKLVANTKGMTATLLLRCQGKRKQSKVKQKALLQELASLAIFAATIRHTCGSWMNGGTCYCHA